MILVATLHVFGTEHVANQYSEKACVLFTSNLLHDAFIGYVMLRYISALTDGQQLRPKRAVQKFMVNFTQVLELKEKCTTLTWEKASTVPPTFVQKRTEPCKSRSPDTSASHIAVQTDRIRCILELRRKTILNFQQEFL